MTADRAPPPPPAPGNPFARFFRWLWDMRESERRLNPARRLLSGGAAAAPRTPGTIAPSTSGAVAPSTSGAVAPAEKLQGWLRRLRESTPRRGSAREKLAELLETPNAPPPGVSESERRLLTNILALRRRTVADVKIPRAAIVAVEIGTPFGELIDILVRENHSRLPVYRETLDDTLGMTHIKDVLAWRGRESEFSLSGIMRRVLFVAPSMQVLDLLLEMRVKRIHLALVVDEFGGVDGLVTIEDLVEEIVGEIEDEHDVGGQPMLKQLSDGSFEADANVGLGEFEAAAGVAFSEDERNTIESLGGLVVAAAGQVPIRGQLVRHDSGLEFEVLDADPRRIKRLRVRRRPAGPPASSVPPAPAAKGPPA